LPYARRSVINATNDQWRRSGRQEDRERHAGTPGLNDAKIRPR
jgi:hypothetical protein